MKNYRLIILFFALLLSACSGGGDPAKIAPPANSGSIPNLVGTYVVNGFDPLGLEYGGHLTIISGHEPGTFLMQWILVGNIQEGLGVLNGNQLIVDWQTIESSTGQTRGTAVYTITEAGQLVGTRYVEGLDGEGTEQAFPNQ